MDDALPTAIDRADLPALVGRYYPDSGAQPGRKGVVFAVWRGDERASFSLFKSDAGRWLYRDHRTCESGNAFGFLTDICGLSRAEAARWLKASKGIGAGTSAPMTPTSAPRGRSVGVEPGEAVYEALLRAVSDKRIPTVNGVTAAWESKRLMQCMVKSRAIRHGTARPYQQQR